jgi:hypothetical protein
VLAQRVLEAVFGDQAIRRLAEQAKEELDARIESLLANELLRFHAILDAQSVTAEQAVRVRRAAAAVQAARSTDGLPALPSAEDRPAIEPPALSQVPALEAGRSDEIVDAELVEPPRTDWR